MRFKKERFPVFYPAVINLSMNNAFVRPGQTLALLKHFYTSFSQGNSCHKNLIALNGPLQNKTAMKTKHLDN